MRNASLKFKLLAMTFILVFILIAVGSALFLYNLDYFRDTTMNRASEEIAQQVESSLPARAHAARAEMRGLVQSGKQGVRILAGAWGLEQFIKSGSDMMNKEAVQEEMKRLFDASTVTVAGAEEQIFAHLRFVNVDGVEVVELEQGSFSDRLQDRSDSQWFQRARKLKDGEVFVSGVNSGSEGQPQLPLATPVYIEGQFKGVVMASLRWRLVGSMSLLQNS